MGNYDKNAVASRISSLRLLLTGARSAAENMAIDEAVMIVGHSPTVRFFTWQPPAISLGYFQSVHEEVDVDACRKKGVDIVRRITGGGAVYHRHEITYSVVMPEPCLPRDILESYKFICSGIVLALRNLGVRAEFAGINDVVVGGKKISGSAQTRRHGMVLQHGTLLLDVDVEEMFSMLKVPSEKVRDKAIRNVKERVTSLRDVIGEVAEDNVVNALIKGFEENFGVPLVRGELLEKEVQISKDLAKTKYGNDDWNFRR